MEEKQKPTTSNPNPYLVPMAIVLAGGLIAGAVWVSSQREAPSTQPAQVQEGEQGAVAGETVRVEVSVDDDAVKGDPQAPLTIIEFSDYECPFCRRFFQETYPQIVKDYIETGKVKYIFRDFPLAGHRNAQITAEAAECAGEQGKYYEYHNKLFENKEEWAEATDVAGLLEKYAADLGLSGTDFAACLDEHQMKDEVQKDLADGQAAGVSGTPTFLIGRGDLITYDKAPTRTDPFFYLGDGKVGVVGAQSFETFKEIIEGWLGR